MKKITSFSIRLDDSRESGKVTHNNAMQPASETKKTPWFLRFAPGAILRKNGIIAVIALATVLTPISAMAAGKIVVFILGWGAGQVLTEAKEALKRKFLNGELKKASASVNGAYWRSNSYSYKKTGDDSNAFGFPDAYRDVQASQGDELFGTARGTADGVALEETSAENILKKQGRYTIISAHGVAVNNDGDRVLVKHITARKDSFSWAKDKALRITRLNNDDDSFEWDDDAWITHTWTRHVGSHMLRSYFRDPNVPPVPQLGAEGSDADGTKHYWATVKWDRYFVNRDATRSSKRVRYGRVKFKAFKSERKLVQLCYPNQVIENQHVSASIGRQVENRPKQIRKRKQYSTGIDGSIWLWDYSTTNRLYTVHIDGGDLYGNGKN